MNHALVILSGGQDSTTCLAMALKAFPKVSAISFDYGQRHARELQAAADVCKLTGVNHEVIVLGDGILAGTSPLTNRSETLEQYSDYKSMDAIIGDRVEKTFVPMRNALFLTVAANRAACMGANKLVTGVCEADNANYPDCRASFISAQEVAINEALGQVLRANPGGDLGIEIWTPLIRRTKAQSIHIMQELAQLPLLAFTHTAYDGQYPPMGSDHATVLRAQGFLEAGVPDPLIVRACMEGLMQLPTTPNYMGDAGWLHELESDIFELKRQLNPTLGAA